MDRIEKRIIRYTTWCTEKRSVGLQNAAYRTRSAGRISGRKDSTPNCFIYEKQDDPQKAWSALPVDGLLIGGEACEASLVYSIFIYAGCFDFDDFLSEAVRCVAVCCTER
jgi:hypothetical protein